MSIVWKERGFIFNVPKSNKIGFAFSHTHKPTPLQINRDVLRIFFGTRSEAGHTRTTYIDVDAHNPSRILDESMPLILDLGKIGAFDDSGANVCSIIALPDRIHMYYIGWNPSTTVHTRNAIGVAVSYDQGRTFSRLYDGAILDRSKDEPYYTGAVDVVHNGEFFEMWYTSGTHWEFIDGKPEIMYHIKYAYSQDGIEWIRPGISCIPPSSPTEATARPSVIRKDGKYLMWFSYRDIDGFRERASSMYRAGYAESNDGRNWTRIDDLAGVTPSSGGWDGDAVAYPYVRKVNESYLMLYNGNGFGRTGFGYCIGE
ncbi:hypothetical protein [Stutzerimonas nitrititolerans]|uniref:hypothetical protein n=1 Tax=Stutzerimonas nitrititolerans TaxID=2482751 RepID=UPI0028AB39B7|nr:hypothetical protein [Stutzerimonas nitrititolerans]